MVGAADQSTVGQGLPANPQMRASTETIRQGNLFTPEANSHENSVSNCAAVELLVSHISSPAPADRSFVDPMNFISCCTILSSRINVDSCTYNLDSRGEVRDS